MIRSKTEDIVTLKINYINKSMLKSDTVISLTKDVNKLKKSNIRYKKKVKDLRLVVKLNEMFF